MMEQIFTEHHNDKTKFICTRFANVAGSRGSVIPFFKSLVSKNQPLKLTSKEMNRLMFSSKEAAELVHSSINLSNHFNESFVLSKKNEICKYVKISHNNVR